MRSPIAKNILFFVNSISPLLGGGLPRVTEIVSAKLTSDGFKCFFVFYEEDNASYPSATKLKIDFSSSYQECEHQLLQFINANDIHVFVAQQIYEDYYLRFYRRIRAAHPNATLLFFLHASPTFWAPNCYLNLRRITWFNLFQLSRNLLKKFLFVAYNPYIGKIKEIHTLSNKVVLLSESYIHLFKTTYSLADTSKLLYIPNPLTFDEKDSLPAEKKKIVIIVSRLEEKQKRISMALEIWRRTTALVDEGWSLYVVGSGPDEEFYKKFQAKHNLRNVTFFGSQSDVLPYYKVASVLIMTSLWEGLPMAILEAKQNGVVPIAFNTFGSLHDLVDDGRNGFIVENNNIDQFVQKLKVLLTNDFVRSKFADRCRQDSSHYHIETIIEKWKSLFN